MPIFAYLGGGGMKKGPKTPYVVCEWSLKEKIATFANNEVFKEALQ